MAPEALDVVHSSELELLGQEIVGELRFAIDICAKACRRWKGHSEDGKLA